MLSPGRRPVAFLDTVSAGKWEISVEKHGVNWPHLFLATALLSGSSPNGLLHEAAPEVSCRREECVPALSASDEVGKIHREACDAETCV